MKIYRSRVEIRQIQETGLERKFSLTNMMGERRIDEHSCRVYKGES